ncbi:heterokaryon incompatibility protein-domain-containing protein [Whalleya microplaca]|nr:heterokaryon incompatibility protein-domain-containing protein [Whalleya microplaca]
MTPFHPAFGYARTVKRTLDADLVIANLNNWIGRCENHHDVCTGSVSKLPRRVIDLSTDRPRLFETTRDHFGKYVTLSHCWGQDTRRQPTKTTWANIQARKREIDPNELCVLFRDVFDLVKKMGYQYVWIDSLCIVQDDESDWQDQSTKMADIYAGAFFHIAGTYAHDSSYSLYIDRRMIASSGFGYPIETFDLAITGEDNLVKMRLSHERDHRFINIPPSEPKGKGCEQQAPLLARAWVLQERLLARRTLHFCGSELIWECNSSYACECTIEPDTFESGFSGSSKQTSRFLTQEWAALVNQKCDKPRPPLRDLYHLWHELINNYSKLVVTKLEDRCYALTGLASRFQRVAGDEYLAGLWTQDLPRNLLWSVFQPGLRSNIAPTWSWISCYRLQKSGTNCPMFYYPWLKEFKKDERVRLHASGTFCTAQRESKFGPVTGQIELEAPCIFGDFGYDDRFLLLP